VLNENPLAPLEDALLQHDLTLTGDDLRTCF
jgi:hypothetical protein